MMRQLAWKECREGAGVWVVMFLLGAAAVFLAAPFAEALSSTAEAAHAFTAVTLFIVCIAYGVITGAMMLAGEREAGTLDFLDYLSPHRRNIWERKLRIGALMALSQGILLAVLGKAFGPAAKPELGSMEPLLPLVSLEGFIWGLLGSALCRTVLSAAFFAAVFGLTGWTLVVGAGMAFGGWPAAALRLVLDAGALVASARIFCEKDAERCATPAKKGRPRMTAASAVAWLAWKQGWTEWLWLAGLAIGLSILAGGRVALLWPWVTLLLGALNGTRVWATEQADGTQRFLADQRLPLSSIWVYKTLLAFASLVLQMLLLILLPFITVRLKLFVEAGETNVERIFYDLGGHPGTISFGGLCWVAGLTSFAAGQLFGIVCRKRIIALIVTLAFSAILAAAWLPSLVAGGLTVWHVLVGPAVLLLTSRLVLDAWSAGRLGSLRPVLIVATGLVLTAGWEAGCLAWRVVGVRDVGQPFDVAAYQAELRTLGQAESAQLIRTALTELAERRKEARDLLPGNASNSNIHSLGVHGVAALGWGKAPAWMGPWLDRLFDGKWPTLLHCGVSLPPGVIETPRAAGLGSPGLQIQEAIHAIQLLTLRAYQLQTRGKDDAALEAMLDALALSRHLRPGATYASFSYIGGPYNTAADGLAHWAGGTRTLALLRRALAEVERHETALPSVRRRCEDRVHQRPP